MRLSSCSDTEVGAYLQLVFARLMVSLQEENESLSKQINDAASAESLVFDSGIPLNRTCEHQEL